MNILIDGRPFVAPSAGIANFLEGSLLAWARQKHHDTFLVALPKSVHKTVSKDIYPQNVIFMEASNWLLRHLPNLVWLCIMMPLLARKWKADIYYSPLPCLPFLLSRSIKKIIVVHDVVNLEYKATMQWTNILSNSLFFKRSVNNADIIWTNSYYTKGKVEQYFPSRKCQQIFTGCSVNREIYHLINLTEQVKGEIRESLGIKGSFILFVGSLEPRKNLSFLLSLMPELYKRYQLQLVVVGGHGWKKSSISQIVNDDGFPKDSVIFCRFITNERLAQLYNMADCFVSASLNEGFGMPQLEALLCDCPIVTAHNSAMIEVAKGKDGAQTIEGYDKEKWINAIASVVSQRPKVNIEQLKAYDWNSILNKLNECVL